MRDKENTEELKSLRRAAEERLGQMAAPIEELTEDEVRALAHELQVHQIELEMQNDELLRAQEEIEESRAKYSDLYDFAPGGYLTIDKKGKVLEANLTAATILGRERGRLKESSLYDFIEKSEKDKLYSHINETIESKIKQSTELCLADSTEGGEERHIRLDSVLEKEQDKEAHCMTSLIDITDEVMAAREKEKLQAQINKTQRMESIGRLAAGLAHDINNTQTAIRGLGRLGKKKIEKTDPLYELFDEIDKVSGRTEALTRQLLIFGRNRPPTQSLLDLNETVNHLTNMLEVLVGKNIVIKRELGASLWTVMGDNGEMEQVITNLVLNARDAMPDGGVISIKTENISIDGESDKSPDFLEEGRYIRFSVGDTGAGIPDEDIVRIFEPFFTTKHMSNNAGSGLGLAVVYRIIKEHNGYIDVDSKVKTGTTFDIYLPVVELASEADKTLLNKERPVESLRGSGEGILLVEDELIVLKATTRNFENEGYLVFNAASSKEAIEIYKKNRGKISLVISDYGLPDMDGLKLIEELQLTDPALKAIVCSGYVDKDIDLERIESKGILFYSKPYAIDSLLVKIKDLIEN
jgi:PAS domain S-box-containing protein